MKNVCGVMLAVLLSGAAYAADDVVTENATTLNLAVRRIGLEWSKTDVRNSEYYQESPVSALKV